MSLLELFCHIDDFVQRFEVHLKAQALPNPDPQAKKRRNRARSLSLSEVMTLLVRFHQSGYRTFKDFYCKYVCVHWRSEFPGLVSYSRLIEFLPSALTALCAYLKTCYGTCSGVSYIDSTPLRVCHNKRISQHKVFAGLAQRGQCSLGWFYGLKLHLLVNHRGELLNVAVSPGNTHDTKPVPKLLNAFFGKVFGDKGYLSKPLFEQLFTTLGITLITRRRKNMKDVLLLAEDKVLLQKRGMIESVIDCLKNECQIEHTRHRSPINALTHLVAGLVAYCHRETKPSIVNKGVLRIAD